MKELGTIVLIVLFGLAAIGALSYKFIKTPHHCGDEEHEGHDNVVEEIVEDVIESQMGVQIDLTPGSPEHS